LASETSLVRDLAFKTIIQNRVSHGGILADGAGLLKNGENGKGILSRWYPATLKRRILNIATVRNEIKFIKGDAFQQVNKNLDSPDAVFFVDPPYTASKKKAGSRLYKYHQVDHEKLFELMSKVKGDFLMTYDDAEEVRDLAQKYYFETRLVSMTNTHNATMTELVIGRDLGWVR
jgi:DNA adenine methylase